MKMPVIGYAGMTHLGLVSAAAAAGHGFDVVCFDPDAKLIERLKRGDLPISEPGLPELLVRHGEQLLFSARLADLGRCDAVYISVDVPTDDQGRSDLDPVRSLIDQVSTAMSESAILVVLSQVPPGFTRSLNFPKERLIYQVETLVFGRAVERAMEPERFIVGCDDPLSPLPSAVQTYLLAFSCPILPMRYESAELAKISINFCLVASVSVANTLAEVSEVIGADWSEISPALRLDRRIGQYSYLNPGLGIAGGNLERDLRTVLTIAEPMGTELGVVRAWIANSQHRKNWPRRTLDKHVLGTNPNAKIAVLGLAYKENTHSTKNSPALSLVEQLKGMDVTVHDPVVSTDIVPFARSAGCAIEAASGADVLVIATPWPQFRNISIVELARVMRGRTILDPFRVLNGASAAANGFSYHTLGAPPLGQSR